VEKRTVNNVHSFLSSVGERTVNVVHPPPYPLRELCHRCAHLSSPTGSRSVTVVHTFPHPREKGSSMCTVTHTREEGEQYVHRYHTREEREHSAHHYLPTMGKTGTTLRIILPTMGRLAPLCAEVSLFRVRYTPLYTPERHTDGHIHHCYTPPRGVPKV